MSTEDDLRKQWLNRYLSAQAKSDTQMRTVLSQAAADIQDRITALSTKSTFSSGVKSAQLKLVMDEVKSTLKDVFNEATPIITDGNKKAAVAAVTAFGNTDREILERVFENSGSIQRFIKGQQQSAANGVANAVSRITKSSKPLSARVYRSQALATGWVQRQVNLGIIRNASAREIANDVSRSVRPTTAGGVSYAAMRLGRTEINNAFHATSITLAQDRPWVTGMAWNLSATHKDSASHIAEVCEIYAARSFTVADVPPKPHPLCRCYATPNVESFDVFLTHLTAGQYKGWIERNIDVAA